MPKLLEELARIRAAVVDPGGEIDRLLAVVAKHGLTLEKILITHAHLDHAGGTAELARRSGVPIEGPQQGDQFWIDGLPDAAANYGFPPAKAFTPTRWLHDGDTVTLIKDLKIKGSSAVVKVGTKVKNIRLVDGDHDIDCKIEGFGPMQLKTEFVKKV